MKKRHLLLIGLLLCILMGVGVSLAWWFSPQTLVYDGKSVESWLQDLDPRLGRSSSERESAKEAFQFLGEKATLAILRDLEIPDSTLQRYFRSVWPKIPSWLKKRLPKPREPKDGFYRQRAVFAINHTGPQSIPHLVSALESKSGAVRHVAASVLGDFGMQSKVAIPRLISIVEDPDGMARVSAVVSLSRIDRDDPRIIPALIGGLDDSDIGPFPGSRVAVRANAARVLGKIGPSAHVATPALLELMNAAGPSSDSMEIEASVQAARAIWYISSDAAIVLPFLIKQLEQFSLKPTLRSSHRENVAVEILDGLADMGQLAEKATPAVRKVEELHRLRRLNPSWNVASKAEEVVTIISGGLNLNSPL